MMNKNDDQHWILQILLHWFSATNKSIIKYLKWMSCAIKVVCSFNWTGCHSILKRQNTYKNVLLEKI